MFHSCFKSGFLEATSDKNVWAAHLLRKRFWEVAVRGSGKGTWKRWQQRTDGYRAPAPAPQDKFCFRVCSTLTRSGQAPEQLTSQTLLPAARKRNSRWDPSRDKYTEDDPEMVKESWRIWAEHRQGPTQWNLKSPTFPFVKWGAWNGWTRSLSQVY